MKKKNTVNLILSAFLITAFVVCTYFFSTLGLTGTAQAVVEALVTVVFGVILFYATRVGEGKPIRRFSIATLIILDLPALYILLCGIATNLPLGETLSANKLVIYLAGAALGYGIPYTFLSGFELAPEDDADGVVEGGILEEMEEADLKEENEEYVEDIEEEIEDTEQEISVNTSEEDVTDDTDTEVD
jgi:hypothetical protein